MSKKRMYIICREDLPPLYASIQGGHALASYALEHPQEFSSWGNSYLIYLKKRNETCLKNLLEKLSGNGIKCATFKEPDIGHQLTAISCYADMSLVKNIDILK